MSKYESNDVRNDDSKDDNNHERFQCRELIGNASKKVTSKKGKDSKSEVGIHRLFKSTTPYIFKTHAPLQKSTGQ